MTTPKTFEITFEGKRITFVVDQWAKECDKSVLCYYGNTTVLTTLVVKETQEINYSFFPLKIEFDEEPSAKGQIPNTFNRRASRGTHSSIKCSRLIDRSLRPFFPLCTNKKVDIRNCLLSVDKECSPLLAAMWNSFLVCYLSEKTPYFNDPLIAIAAFKKNNIIFCHLDCEEVFFSPLEMIISILDSEEKKILSIDLKASEIKEDELIQTIDFCLEKVTTLSNFFREIKRTLNINEKSLEKEKDLFSKEINDLKKKAKEKLIPVILENTPWHHKKKKIEKELQTFIKENNIETEKETNKGFFENVWNGCLREISEEMLENNNTRIDGRKSDEIRDISIKTAVLPSPVHGSAIFERGCTQVLSVSTIGKSSEKMVIDSILFPFVFNKHFIHHYNFPSFCVNEIDTTHSLSRREVGHGELVEKSFFFLLPHVDSFSHTICVRSLVLSSDGSSSQASICATSLALMTSGVPLARLVAGISLGIIGEKIVIDINGIEDKIGGMDFKIAGTEEGICSIQLDVKKKGIDLKTIKTSFFKAKEARLSIIEKMNNSISKTKFLPSVTMKYKSIYIGKEIGIIIGPGRTMLKKIAKKTGTDIEIDEKKEQNLLVYYKEEKDLDRVHEEIENILKKKRQNI